MSKNQLKKIAVLHRYPPNQVIGTNASFIEFLRILSRKNIKIFYVTYKDKSTFPEIEGLTYVFLPFFFNRGNTKDKIIKTYLWIFLVPFYVLYLQTRFKLDLVYCDDSVPYFGFLSKVLSPFSKVVIRLGDLQTGYELYDNHKSLFKLALAVEVAMWKAVDGLVAISEPFRNFIIEQGINGRKIKVVEESVNLSNLKPIVDVKNVDTEGSSFNTVLFHGSLVSCKGLEVLLEAFSILKGKEEETSHEKNWKLVIAGGGPKEQELKKVAAALGLENVVFTGWYDHKKLEGTMKNVDVSIVMRSPNFANNFVVTTCLLENWAYGKPVIAPDLACFASVIKDGVNGFLFKTGNADDLARKIKYLFEHKEIWQSLTRDGRQTAKNLFDHKLIAEKMFDELISISTMS